MNNKGFTLMEILGVITLLAILSTLIILSVNKSLKDSKETLYQQQIEEIKAAAGMWRTDNIEIIPDNDYYIVSLQQLKDEGYIKKDIINPKTDQPFDNNMLIEIGMNEIQIGNNDNIAQKTDTYINQEIQAIKDKLLYSTPDGIYYYNNQGNLERDANIIYPTRSWNKPKGNILIHNHQFISGCIQINGINYDVYKTTITQQDYPCSTIRGENLVVNGDLSFGDNTNFNDFTYVSEEGTNGYLSYTTSRTGRITNGNYIAVDLNDKYEIGSTVKTNNSITQTYLGFYAYDIDRQQVEAKNIMYIPNTLTTLARDLNDGDEYIYLTDMSNWVKTNSYIRHGFIFWNYKDSTGYEYPELTYSRNIWYDIYDEKDEFENDNIDLVNNTIKLKNPWDKGYIKSGTKLSQSDNGNQYHYTNSGNFDTTWTEYSNVISGINDDGGNNMFKFRQGTRYIQWFTWPNASSTSDVTTYYKNIYLREVVE